MSIVSGQGLLQVADPKDHLLMDQGKLIELLTAKKRICEYKMRLWEGPKRGFHYAIGIDPSEGLLHGDAAAIEVFCVETGRQVMEVEGTIHPFDLAEIAWLVGTYYSHRVIKDGIEVCTPALVAIENNKDGGANAKLLELGYTNLYFLAEDKGEGYQQQLPKLGINMSSRRRAELISKGRNWCEDGSVIVKSSLLLGQMEIFQLRNGKFQAPLGGHDDLVMAFLITVEMIEVVQLTMELNAKEGLRPYADGQKVPHDETDVGDEWEEEKPLVEKLIERTREKQKEAGPEEWVTEFDNLDDMEGMW